MGRVHKHWCAKRIEELSMCIVGEQIPVYIGHSRGRSRRVPIGYIIDSYVELVEKNMNAMAVVHITDPLAVERAQNRLLDLASIEADFGLDPVSNGWDVAEVERVTGLALEDSTYNTPGFERSGLVRFMGGDE